MRVRLDRLALYSEESNHESDFKQPGRQSPPRHTVVLVIKIAATTLVKPAAMRCPCR
jgi:hypothetical protein